VHVTAHLRAAAKGAVNPRNMNSVPVALDRYGARYGLDRPHRSLQCLAQLSHESGDFNFDRKIWGRQTPRSATTHARISATHPRSTATASSTWGAPPANSRERGITRRFATGASPGSSILPTSLLSLISSTTIRGKVSCRPGTGRAATSIVGPTKATSRRSQRSGTAA
jgi:hypothetical protein